MLQSRAGKAYIRYSIRINVPVWVMDFIYFLRDYQKSKKSHAELKMRVLHVRLHHKLTPAWDPTEYQS